MRRKGGDDPHGTAKPHLLASVKSTNIIVDRGTCVHVGHRLFMAVELKSGGSPDPGALDAHLRFVTVINANGDRSPKAVECLRRHCHGPYGLRPVAGLVSKAMQKISYDGYRFPPEIIRQAIWLCLRFTLSLRDVEDLLAERGIVVSYETVRRWVNHFGPTIAAELRKRRPNPYASWHLDEMYLKIAGRMVYLWRPSTRRAKFSTS